MKMGEERRHACRMRAARVMCCTRMLNVRDCMCSDGCDGESGGDLPRCGLVKCARGACLASAFGMVCT